MAPFFRGLGRRTCGAVGLDPQWNHGALVPVVSWKLEPRISGFQTEAAWDRGSWRPRRKTRMLHEQPTKATVAQNATTFPRKKNLRSQRSHLAGRGPITSAFNVEMLS